MSSCFLYGFVDADESLPEFLRADERCRAITIEEVEAPGDEVDPWDRLLGGDSGQAEFFVLRLGAELTDE